MCWTFFSLASKILGDWGLKTKRATGRYSLHQILQRHTNADVTLNCQHRHAPASARINAEPSYSGRGSCHGAVRLPTRKEALPRRGQDDGIETMFNIDRRQFSQYSRLRDPAHLAKAGCPEWRRLTADRHSRPRLSTQEQAYLCWIPDRKSRLDSRGTRSVWAECYDAALFSEYLYNALGVLLRCCFWPAGHGPRPLSSSEAAGQLVELGLTTISS